MATPQKAATPGKALAAPAPSSPAIPKDTLALFEQEAGAGFEGTTSKDFQIPFISLLQKLSPQCDKEDGAYVEGAEPGMFYDPASGELIESVRIIPCHYKRSIVEWKPDRNGFVAQHEPGIEEGKSTNERGIPLTEDGNLLVDTRYFFCIRLNDDNEPSTVIVAMSSTQLKVAKNWMSRMQAMKMTGEGGRRYTPPMYSHIWKMSSVDQENEKGKWKGIKVEVEGPIAEANLFNLAKESKIIFQTTEVKPAALLEEGEAVGAGGEKKM